MASTSVQTTKRLSFLPSVAQIANNSVIIAFILICLVFAIASPTFLTPANLMNILINNVVLLAIVALGLTLVISSGGIDLSVGVSVDMASMVLVMLLAAQYSAPIAILGGVAAAFAVGLLNTVLITQLKISPFLATLGVLFIGQSVQQLATSGGQPIYLITGPAGAVFNTIAHTSVIGVPTPVVILAACSALTYFVLHRTIFGRRIFAMGAQEGVAWYSGVRVPAIQSLVYIGCAVLCAVTGILLSATVKSYVPLSGNAFLLNGIGAVFLGTTLSARRRPSVLGTLLGVVLLAVIKNGLLLVGWNFFWQQVGIGVVVFLVLAVSFGLRGRAD